MTELPSGVYLVVGILAVSNFGVIITFLTFIFRAGMFVSKTNLGIKEAKDTAIRAHKRIDAISAHPPA